MHAAACDTASLVAPDDVERVAEATHRAPRSLRVLHVINGQHYSGAERVQDLLALNLSRFGFEVGFACLKPGRFADLRQAQQATVIEMPMSFRFDLRPAFRLARKIRRENYALVHTHTPRAVLVGRVASALAGVPLVHHVHSPTASDSTRVRQDRWNARIERASLGGASAVIAVSRSLAGYAAAQGITENRITVVPNGVPVRGPLVERTPPTDSWTLGTVALFRPRKGLEVLLEALASLRSQGLDVHLRAAGEFETAEYERKIHLQVQRLAIGDLVRWTGFTQDVPAELAKMDLFVLPSLFGEGLPMVILEAMAAGVPIVATRVEGVPEAIRDGIEGLVANPNDPADLARAIARFVRGQADWSHFRIAAHQRQADRFSDHSMAAGVADVYQRVLA
jgi:glycosyltransferase involved in cell wall biosynthesis